MLRREQKWWQVQYLGAFAALGVSNVAMAEELAALTETDQECVHAIGVMRRAKDGDRVYPALQSLRALRSPGFDGPIVGCFICCRGRQACCPAHGDAEPAPGATTDGAAADACVGATLGGGR